MEDESPTLSKQQGLDADPKATQQINFTWNLNRDEDVNDNTKYFSLLRCERNNFRFFTRNCESIVNSFYFNIIPV